MPDQLPLFGFSETRPKIRVKKMISQTRIKEALAQRDGSIQNQIAAMRNFREDLEDFERRIKNK